MRVHKYVPFCGYSTSRLIEIKAGNYLELSMHYEIICFVQWHNIFATDLTETHDPQLPANPSSILEPLRHDTQLLQREERKKRKK